MRNILLSGIFIFCAAFYVSAQEEIPALASEPAVEKPVSETPRKKYFNIGFVNQKFTTPSYYGFDQKLKSNYGVSISRGRTYFLHKKPLARMIRFGIDATWIDINFTNYKLQYEYGGSDYSFGYGGYEEETETTNFYQVEVAMQVGPSITVSPIKNLNVNAYFRYAPGFSGLYDSDSFHGAFSSYFVGGGTVYYKMIGVGVEARFGSCKYKTAGFLEELEEEFGYESGDEQKSMGNEKSKFSGMRVYVTFRF